MSSVDFSTNTYSFGSTFADMPVKIEYEIDVSEDHRGRDVNIVPTYCVILGPDGTAHRIDLCEDAGLFHIDTLRKWQAEAEADAKGSDDGEPEYNGAPSDFAAAAAEDRWIAARDQAHYCRAGL